MTGPRRKTAAARSEKALRTEKITNELVCSTADIEEIVSQIDHKKPDKITGGRSVIRGRRPIGLINQIYRPHSMPTLACKVLQADSLGPGLIGYNFVATNVH